MRLRPINEEEFLRSARESCVEPVDIVGREHFVGHIALVYVDVRPLSALRLMARDGIGVLYLQRIVVGISFQTLVAFGLGAHIGVVCHHLIEELLILFACEGRSLSSERVGKRRHLQLVVVVVGELQPEVDEVEAVEVAAVAHALYHGTVAVGYERWGRATLLLVVGCRDVGCSSGRRVGEHQFGGYILMQNARGDVMRRNFLQKYTVIPAPNTATVAADMMNVLYAGFQNPVSISVPGVPANAVSATMTGGSFISKGNGRFVAVPSAVGKDVTIHVTARDKGQTRTMPPFVFHVRKLPDPTAYLALGTNRFRGGALSKASLMGASGIHAAIDDGLLDIPFRVLSFETVFFDNMGNAVPLASAGANFSERQREEFRRLSRNRRFYISHIKAVGPDGITRNLPAAMEVIVR
mgnify:CR=1 FL=1